MKKFLVSSLLFLLEYSLCNAYVSYENHQNPLIQAIVDNKRQDIEKYLTGKNINPNDPSKGTPLIAAIYKNNVPLASKLIDKGANVNASDEENSPLSEAIRKENQEAVTLLIEKGANINDEAHPALLWAIAMQNMSILDTLLAEKNLDINIKNELGQTALIRSDDRAILQKLMQKKPNLEIADNDGLTAYLWGARRANVEKIELLAQAGANTKARDNKNNTALLLWVDNAGPKFYPVPKILLTDLDAKNSKGETAITILADTLNKYDQPNPNAELANKIQYIKSNLEALIQAGAKTDLKGKNNKSFNDYVRESQQNSALRKIAQEVEKSSPEQELKINLAQLEVSLNMLKSKIA